MRSTYITIKKIKTEEDFQLLNQELQGDLNEPLFQTFQHHVNSLPWYQNHSLRKNGIKAILLQFIYIDKNADIIPDIWANACMDWMKVTFAVSDQTLLFYHFQKDPTGGSVYAILIPINPDGRISYEYYFPNRKDFLECIDSYSNYMYRKFRLSRPGTNVIHAISKKQNFLIKKTSDSVLPAPLAQESANDYYARIQDVFWDRAIFSLSELNERTKEIEKENESLTKELMPLYHMTKKYGSPEKWEPMLKTALKLQSAVRICQAEGNTELLQSLAYLLNKVH